MGFEDRDVIDDFDEPNRRRIHDGGSLAPGMISGTNVPYMKWRTRPEASVVVPLGVNIYGKEVRRGAVGLLTSVSGCVEGHGGISRG